MSGLFPKFSNGSVSSLTLLYQFLIYGHVVYHLGGGPQAFCRFFRLFWNVPSLMVYLLVSPVRVFAYIFLGRRDRVVLVSPFFFVVRVVPSGATFASIFYGRHVSRGFFVLVCTVGVGWGSTL